MECNLFANTNAHHIIIFFLKGSHPNNREDNGKCVENVARHWRDFQFMNGEIHDLDKDHSENQYKVALNK